MSSFFKSGNPVLGEKTFRNSVDPSYAETMTVRGTLNKFSMLFLLTMAMASIAWKMFYSGKDITGYMWGTLIGALVVALVVSFKTSWSPYLAPLYAILKGFAIGGISAIYNSAFEKIAPNIITQAVALTFGVVIAMFLLYNFRIIKATEKFKSIVITATAGVAIFYLIALGLRFAGIDIPFIHEGSAIGIGFSLLVVGLAALNLIIDFDMIEQGSHYGAPKYMEWYGAFGLLVTIVWLYIEVLRLLSKFAKK
jgi:uncharacterized YccA/Bax inhibitor family protein